MELDVVIPVYEEGDRLRPVLEALAREVRTPFRVLVCYDHDEDSTLAALAATPPPCPVELVKNRGRGAHGAVLSGFLASTAPGVLVMPADDDYNAGVIDAMVSLLRGGCELVCASRFLPGGGMVGCPWLKSVLVRTSAFALRHAARLPTRDPSNGFRLFSRRVIDRIEIESSRGFTYSLELLVKVHRLGWPVGEVPARWFERRAGRSRFQVVRWLPAYLRWFLYAFATTYLRRPASTVPLRAERSA